MASGWFGYSGAFPADAAGRLFYFPYPGSGGNLSPHDNGLGVKGSLDADSTWELRFPVTNPLPTGTLKLRLWALANATSGVAQVQVSDGAVAAGGDPSSVLLGVEAGASITWGAGDNDVYKELKINLSASPAASGMLVVALTFKTASWTLAAKSCWLAWIGWE